MIPDVRTAYMPRTDVHRPTALVTENYEFFGCGYYGAAGEPGYSPLNTPEGRSLLEKSWRMAPVNGGGCDHCGARLRYYALLLHHPSREIIRVGETCLDNRFSLATAEFQRLRKQSALDRAKQRIKAARALWFATDEDREVAFTWASERVENGQYGWEGMRHNFVHQINRYGSVSDRFVKAIMRDMARTERMEAESAAEKARREAESVPCPEGVQEIKGKIVSVKIKENAYGSRLVMTVRDDRGFTVWGTVPSGIGNVERGDTVSFTAGVERSDRDESFGFFKRPRNASLVGA